MGASFIKCGLTILVDQLNACTCHLCRYQNRWRSLWFVRFLYVVLPNSTIIERFPFKYFVISIIFCTFADELERTEKNDCYEDSI